MQKEEKAVCFTAGLLCRMAKGKDPQKFTAVRYVHVVLFYNLILPGSVARLSPPHIFEERAWQQYYKDSPESKLCMVMKFIDHMMFTVTGCSERNLVMVFTTLVVNSGGRGNCDCAKHVT